MGRSWQFFFYVRAVAVQNDNQLSHNIMHQGLAAAPAAATVASAASDAFRAVFRVFRGRFPGCVTKLQNEDLSRHVRLVSFLDRIHRHHSHFWSAASIFQGGVCVASPCLPQLSPLPLSPPRCRRSRRRRCRRTRRRRRSRHRFRRRSRRRSRHRFRRRRTHRF